MQKTSLILTAFFVASIMALGLAGCSKEEANKDAQAARAFADLNRLVREAKRGVGKQAASQSDAERIGNLEARIAQLEGLPQALQAGEDVSSYESELAALDEELDTVEETGSNEDKASLQGVNEKLAGILELVQQIKALCAELSPKQCQEAAEEGYAEYEEYVAEAEDFPGEEPGVGDWVSIIYEPYAGGDTGGVVVAGAGQAYYYIYDTAGKKLTYKSTGQTLELLPGNYEVEVHGVRRPLTVKAGRQAKLQSGTVLVDGAGQAYYYIYDTAGKKLTYKSTGQTLELLPGNYQLEIQGRKFPLEIKPGEQSGIKP